MKAVVYAVAAVLLLGASPQQYTVDFGRYFSSPGAEAANRGKVVAAVQAFVASATPNSAQSLLRWLKEYDGLLKDLQRHDIYVYLRAEEDVDDTLDAKADDLLGNLENRVADRVVAAMQQLGPARIGRLVKLSTLAPYRYLLETSLTGAAHRLDAAEARSVSLAVTPVLDAATASYKALRRSPDPIANHQEVYAALLVSIAAARNGIARLRGFHDAAEASYFEKSIPPDSVQRTLRAVRSSMAYAHYRNVAALAPKPGFTPGPLAVGDAIPIVLAAEEAMGEEYAGAYAALLNPQYHRLEVCTAPSCDDSGFSLGFAGVDSVAFFGGYSGTTSNARAIAHESGHAVHREFMSRNQPIAAYNEGPHFMFESFAIFNELLFLDHLYQIAPNDAQRAYYLDYFLSDATFQVFGSAEETELESAIYRGVDDGTIKTAADFDALTTEVFARYDPAAERSPDASLYWARNRLFFTDPLYDVNYLYAGLLALQYFTDFEHDPRAFSKSYVALLKNGFNASPAALEKRFLGIDLANEAGLVANASGLVDARTAMLAKLYSNQVQKC
jgi:oligoendopeptidase F